MKVIIINADELFPVIHLMEQRPAYLVAMTCAEGENAQLKLFYGMDNFK